MERKTNARAETRRSQKDIRLRAEKVTSLLITSNKRCNTESTHRDSFGQSGQQTRNDQELLISNFWT